MALLLFFAATIAWGASPPAPLKPPDRSSPRAALQTFLDAGDAVSAYIAKDYLPAPSRAKFNHLIEIGSIAIESLDFSGRSAAWQRKGGRAATLALYETLNRIPLPPFDQIPGTYPLVEPASGAAVRWVIPDTRIALVRMASGPRAGEFLFSPETVSNAESDYARVRDLPSIRPTQVGDLREIIESGGGWMIPYHWVEAMPAVLRVPLADQALWKWIGFALVVVAYVLFLLGANNASHRFRGRSLFLDALAQLALPVSILAATPAAAYLTLVQINVTDEVGVVVTIAVIVVMFLAAAWLSWRLAPVVAEAIIASPKISPEGIDAHLIRVSARLLAVFGSAGFLALGADRLGVPVYGIVAGLGVGGLAIALAAQPTIENLIGGLNLFADKPIRVGDFCEYGSEAGTVEAIGIRSTRIRGLDRTLTTIPNAALAKMPIVNRTRRDRILLRTVVGLRYETTPEQLRYVLVRLRELLVGHPRIDPETARARFVNFGNSSLDVEVFAYVTTREWTEFLGIREDVLLRVMDVIAQAGAAVAFPSQTLYLGRDAGPDDGRVQAAEATVRAWRDEGSLPFPNFSPEQARVLHGSVAFPPPGSTAASAGRPDAHADAVRHSRAGDVAAARGGEPAK